MEPELKAIAKAVASIAEDIASLRTGVEEKFDKMEAQLIAIAADAVVKKLAELSIDATASSCNTLAINQMILSGENAKNISLSDAKNGMNTSTI